MTDVGPKRACFTSEIDGKKGKPFEVHFNPTSLDYTITNTLKQGSGKKPTQHVTQSTGKLSMELVFDTTHNGEDVRIHTEKVAKLMQPAKDQGPPPIAHFEWGAYKFAGMVESYKEKIDFFSSDGVPLRATVNLTLSRQDKVFDSGKNPPTSSVGGRLDAAERVAEAPTSPRENLSRLAGRGGDPSAARAIAAMNGFESLRAPGAAVVQLSAEVTLSPPVAFAGGGASLDLSLSLGGGLSLDLGGAGGAGLDLDFGASIGAAADAIAGALGSFGSGGAAAPSGGGTPAPSGGGAAAPDATRPGGSSSGSGNVLGSIFGGRAKDVVQGTAREQHGLVTQEVVTRNQFLAGAQGSHAAGGERERGTSSAGVSASEGAFDALTQGRGFRRHKPLDVESLVRPVEIEGYGTGTGVGFRIGGQATMLGAASVSADVGRNVSLLERIAFDREEGG